MQKKTVKHHLRNFGRAIIVFFDLDLLRDPIYVNLMLGITFANFTELNFALLTPFILGEYGFTKLEVATFMSTLGGVDVITRIVIPFVATYIGWENRTFFLIGVGGLGIGRLGIFVDSFKTEFFPEYKNCFEFGSQYSQIMWRKSCLHTGGNVQVRLTILFGSLMSDYNVSSIS